MLHRHTPDRAGMTRVFDALCPMHLVVDATGHISHCGPTLRKVLGGQGGIGQRLFEIFQLKRPHLNDLSMISLRLFEGKRLCFALRSAPRTELKGVLIALPDCGSFGPPGSMMINLSFGISVVEGVRDFDLSSADFATTDLTVEMLYLVEAKSAAMEASRKLNLRLQGAKIAAEERAFTDGLTGLRNRRVLEPVLTRLIESGEAFAIMQLDLDHFKAVNDTWGHAAGDHVLGEVACIFRQETRTGDTVIRAGGDEFILVFAPLDRPGTLGRIADRLICRLEEPIVFDEQTCQISASIGTTLSRTYDRPCISRMLEDADLALYSAKAEGRGCHRAFDPVMRARPAGPETRTPTR